MVTGDSEHNKVDIFYIKVDIFYANDPNKVDIFYVSERIKWTSSTQSDWADYGRFQGHSDVFSLYISYNRRHNRISII